MGLELKILINTQLISGEGYDRASELEHIIYYIYS